MNKSPDNNVFRQRFKAVENFLRRIAFNLGNTPSQTDVKIISCIPIDVSDLQQKIIRLQNELENTKRNLSRDSQNRRSHCAAPALFTGKCEDDIKIVEEDTEEDSLFSGSNMSSQDSEVQRKRPRNKSSSFLYRSETSQDYRFYSHHQIPTDDKSRSAKNQTLRNFFSKKKNKSKRKDGQVNDPLVYYSQTHERNPFNAFSDELTSKPVNDDFSPRLDDLPDDLSRGFINDLFRRQYRPDPIFKVFSNSSSFSAPICKDTTDINPDLCREAEMCSCCQGPTIARHGNREENTTPNHKARYYDSKHYDLVPVRENSLPTKNRNELPKRNKSVRKIVKCCPDEIRPKLVSPIVVDCNYYNDSYRPLRPSADTYPKHIPVIIRSRRQMVLNEMESRRINYRSPQPLRMTRPSRDCYVDYGPTYTKQTGNEIAHNISKNVSTLRNEVPHSAPADNVNGKPHYEPPPTLTETITPLNKTEVTLNQIKEILQSVLLEVKTKDVKMAAPLKKDAVVQNGVSHNNLHGGSELIQSFTYSPYNMDTYSASCSRQAHSNNFAYSGIAGAPVKCLQHYPILIQPQRNLCIGCYRKTNSMKNIPPNEHRHAASTATNTEHARAHTSETEKLIHEIYKSLAMNIEVHQKTSADERHDRFAQNTTVTDRGVPEPNRSSNHNTRAVSEIYRNAAHLDSSVTPNTDTTHASKEVLNETASHLPIIKKLIVPTRETSSVDGDTVSVDDVKESVKVKTPVVESDEESDTTDSAHSQHPQQSTSDSDSDEQVVHATPIRDTKKKKNGIFNKMLQMLKPKKGNVHRHAAIEKSSESDSDSDDYQTVYSIGDSPPNETRRGLSIKSKPKVVYRRYQKKSNSPHNTKRREPYMEQEHRRRWNEKLSFHEDRQGSWPRAMQTMPDSLTGRAPVYRQNYETRSAFIQRPVKPPLAAAMGQAYANGFGSNQYAGHSVLRHNTLNNYARRPSYPSENYCPRVHPNQGIHINYPGKNVMAGLGVSAPRYITPRVHRGTHRVTSSKGLSWLKKRGKKFAPACGEQWRKILTEG